ncbi:hypothetical protein [Streptomyces ehimensis]|uniref:Uncharacterized protein n=1 Tax=Streptomyces ehimensis TaxID=68195 RepID=A0ABV9BTH0_9ACTN
MGSLATRIASAKVAKNALADARTAAAIGPTASISNASNEASRDASCRGHWYSAPGQDYCANITNFPSYGYYTIYNCNTELDTQNYDKLYQGDTHECTFKINGTRVGL